MNHIEKLLRKISSKQSMALLTLMRQIRAGDKEVISKAVKLKGSELYKIRKGDFRAMFHHEPDRIIIDSVRYRNEKTYKNLPK